MGKDMTYYVAENGLEYMSEADAIKFGGGAKGQRVVTADRYQYFEKPIMPAEAPPVAPVQAATPVAPIVAVPQAAVAPATTADVALDNGNLDLAGDDRLREFLKANKVLGAHLMGRPKMLQKAKEILTKDLI